MSDFPESRTPVLTPVSLPPMSAHVPEAQSWRLGRREDARLITGAGRYVGDLDIADCLEVAFVRSRVAHGRLVRVDTSAAAEGRRGGRRVERGGHGRRGAVRALVLPPPGRTERIPALAVDRVRYVGEPVAVILGADRYVAEDGADAVRVAIDPLPALVDPGEAAASSTWLFDGMDNVAGEMEFGDPIPDEVWRQAHVVVEGVVPPAAARSYPDGAPGDPRRARGGRAPDGLGLTPVASPAAAGTCPRRWSWTPSGSGCGCRTAAAPSARRAARSPSTCRWCGWRCSSPPGPMARGPRRDAVWRNARTGPEPAGAPRRRRERPDARAVARRRRRHRRLPARRVRRGRDRAGRGRCVPHPDGPRPDPHGGHQHDAHGAVPRRGTSRAGLRGGAHGRPSRSRARHGSGGVAAAQLHPAGGVPVRVTDRPALRQRAVRAGAGQGAGAGRLRVLAGGAAAASAVGQRAAARHRDLQLRRALGARTEAQGERVGGPRRRSRRERHRTRRHLLHGPEPRDRLPRARGAHPRHPARTTSRSSRRTPTRCPRASAPSGAGRCRSAARPCTRRRGT